MTDTESAPTVGCKGYKIDLPDDREVFLGFVPEKKQYALQFRTGKSVMSFCLSREAMDALLSLHETLHSTDALEAGVIDQARLRYIVTTLGDKISGILHEVRP